jgi:hypothetical protein
VEKKNEIILDSYLKKVGRKEIPAKVSIQNISLPPFVSSKH